MFYKFNGVLTLTVLVCVQLLACASTEDETTVTVDTTPASIPTDAITITDVNALTIANMSLESDTLIISKTDQSTATSSNPLHTLNTVINMLFAEQSNKSGSTALAAKTETQNCISGTIIRNYTVSGNTSSGTISFNNCVDSTATGLNGALYYDITLNTTTNAYVYHTSGSLTVSDASDTYRIYGIQVTITGDNDSPDPYARATTFAVTGLNTLGGFMYETSSPLSGNSLSCFPSAGSVIISGANGTKLRVTAEDTTYVSISINDGDATNGTGYVPFSTIQWTDFTPFCY